MALNLRTIDLNLLVVFDAVYAAGNLSRAAEQLAMTQPAVSNALGRFRALTRDRLFVRGARGVTPTPLADRLAEPVRRALELVREGLEGVRGARGVTPTPLADRLAEPVRRALELVREGLEGVRAFDPRTSTRSFTLSSAFGIEVLVGAGFLDWVRRAAPGVTVRGTTVVDRQKLWTDLRDGIVDVAADFIPPRDARFASERVMQAEAVVVVRAAHPRIRSRLTLAAYLAEEHVVLSRASLADMRLDGAEPLLALDRKVLLEVPSTLSVALVVSQSDLVGVLGRRLAEALAPQLGLKILPIPVKLPLFPAYLVWHRSRDADPGHRWLRKGIKDIFAKL